jgi:aspartate aminotransferase
VIKIQEPLVSCGVSFAQYAAITALNSSKTCVEEMRKEYKQRRDNSLKILENRNRKSSYIPGGAFYLPIDISKTGF